jgi:regulator of protease activity HflC (stomatin/prohibitin superfamily)
MRSAAAVFFGLLLITFFSFTVVLIESGNVGVRKTLGKVNPEEVSPGLNFRVPVVTRITEFVGKEIAIDLTDLTPKAADNLSLRDMDVTVFYKAASGQIADLYVKYANAHHYDKESDSYFPAYRLVYREARRAAYETVAEIDSLTMHKKREQIADSIEARLQETLDSNDPAVFEVTRVVIRSVLTDPSIEESIREAVANQKRLEAKQVMVEIERKNAEIEAIRAQGIANANDIINKTLTTEYLQHELNLTLQKFAETGANTIVVPANMHGFNMILPTDKLTKR